MNDIKVTSYDFSYLHVNPFTDITNKILQGSINKVDVDTTRVKVPEPSDLYWLMGYVPFWNQIWGESTSALDEEQQIRFDIETLKAQQANATNYNDWMNASLELDQLEGNDKWKLKEKSNLYDYNEVRSQLEQLRFCRANGDYDQLLYIIRTSWKRDFAGINNEDLYKRCHIGTKKLIEDYIKECKECLNDLASLNCPLDDKYLLEVLLESKRNYGRAAITMSGGGSFGLIGIGLFSTLLENDVLPKIVSGSSGGSIVSSIVCSKSSDEVISILTQLFDKKFEVFNLNDDPDTFYTHLSRFLKYGVWFDNKYLQNTMQGFLGNITFREAYNKTGRILNITVSSASIHDQPTLINYLTAPNVLVWSAVCASCSLPFVFPSSTIYEKNMETGEIERWSNPSLKFVDGSLNSDLPIPRLSEMFNVNHVIACQVNPHITPLVKLAAECLDVTNSGLPWAMKRYAFKLASLATQETIHYLDILKELGICENLVQKVKQMLMQSYSGDITILPAIKSNELEKTLANPSPSFIWECILNGARSTWPKLSLIKDQLSLEFAMDKYISVIKSRVVFGGSNSKKIDSGSLGMPVIKGVRSLSSMSALPENKIRPSSNSVVDYNKKWSPASTKRKEFAVNSKVGPNKGSPFNKKFHLGARSRGKTVAIGQINDDYPDSYRSVANESPLGNKHYSLDHKGSLNTLKNQQLEKINSDEPNEVDNLVPSTYSYYEVGDDFEIKRSEYSSQSLSALVSETSRGSKKSIRVPVNGHVRSNSSTENNPLVGQWSGNSSRRTSWSNKNKPNKDSLIIPRSAGALLYRKRSGSSDKHG